MPLGKDNTVLKSDPYLSDDPQTRTDMERLPSPAKRRAEQVRQEREDTRSLPNAYGPPMRHMHKE